METNKSKYNYLDSVPNINITLKVDLFTPQVSVNSLKIKEAFKNTWTKESAYDPNGEDVEDGSCVGQCNITSLLMWEVFGLPIVIMKYYDVGNKSRLKTHYANLINENTIIDFSQDQYDDTCVLLKDSGVLWEKKPYILRRMAYGKMQDDKYFAIVDKFKQECLK